MDISQTDVVPSDEDPGLTFQSGYPKKCKEIETCVLYIDIRKSTDLNFEHYRPTLVRLYTAFVKSMIKGAEHFGGVIRNIVGDRVMVVFPSSNCIRMAMNTAALLNTISKYIINDKFKQNQIKCGIGVDYGKMLVAKVGQVKQDKERSAYKNLVWIGAPANVASKLTDLANSTRMVDGRKYAFSPILFSDRVKRGYDHIAAANHNLGKNWASEQKFVIFSFADLSAIYGCSLEYSEAMKKA